jgi:uncharacterized protein (DUF2236 family)
MIAKKIKPPLISYLLVFLFLILPHEATFVKSIIAYLSFMRGTLQGGRKQQHHKAHHAMSSQAFQEHTQMPHKDRQARMNPFADIVLWQGA